MKKSIMIVFAIIFAASLFLNSNSVLGSDGLDLSNLVSLNSAEAECGYVYDRPGWKCDSFNNCNAWGVWASCSN